MQIILGTVEVHRGSACATKVWYGLDWFGLVWFLVFLVPFYIQVKKKEGWCPSTFNRCRERWREGPTLPGSSNCSPILHSGEEEGRAGPSLHLTPF